MSEIKKFLLQSDVLSSSVIPKAFIELIVKKRNSSEAKEIHHWMINELGFKEKNINELSVIPLNHLSPDTSLFSPDECEAFNSKNHLRNIPVYHTGFLTKLRVKMLKNIENLNDIRKNQLTKKGDENNDEL